MATRVRSEEIYKRSCGVFPGGVNSPTRAFRNLGMTPMIVSSGAGDRIWDADGQSYIDYCGSWGALILGHAHPRVVQAACEQIGKGSSFGITVEAEERLAAQIISSVPTIEKLRFVTSGTEATMTAIRLARGYTGRPKIIKFSGHYHGHSDSLLARAGSGALMLNATSTSKGVTPGTIADTICLNFNDASQIRTFFRESPLAAEVAAVILEPIAGNMGVVLPEPGFLQLLREETKRVGALLIFDEVITGFRVGLPGAQGLYSIRPDLSCFGKIIGGGFLVAAVGGRADIMDCLAPIGEVYQAGTLAGNPVAMVAGIEVIQCLKEPHFYETLKEKTNRLTGPIRSALLRLNRNGCIQQAGSMFTLFIGPRQVLSSDDLVSLDSERFARLFRYLFEKGIYIPPAQQEAWFVSSAHSDENIDTTAECVVHFIEKLW